jgi:asparagine synthase (glutamine-hydrolysing)
MCGLTGFWDPKANLSKETLLHLAEKMAEKIDHRGPDSFGVWCDERQGIAFGHRRLSIVDLSLTGHQPMISSSGGWVLSYNGEVYNAAELRAELQNHGCQFRGTSDTEVILEGCAVWGVEATCRKLIGMFAFSLWDKEHQKLFLVRDRLGIKPMYWGYHHGLLLFGSQPKSFVTHPSYQPSIDRDALTAYFRFNYVPTPLSIFKGIQKQRPGTILTFDASGVSKETHFWSFEEVAKNGINDRRQQSDAVLIDELDTLLKDAVKRRMIADVPLGAFLSGGIDSSTVVALMQAQSATPIKSFSIGFHEDTYNEAKYAAQVAKHLGTEHHELYLHSDDAQSIIPNIPEWCDEPFADSSQIPTYLVSKMAREHVKVSLSGDGGDELFAGYNRYMVGQNIWKKIDILPIWLRQIGASSIHGLTPAQWDCFSKLIPQKRRPQLLGDKLYKLAEALSATRSDQFYRSLVSQWSHPEELVIGGREPILYPWKDGHLSSIPHFMEQMQYMDTLSYLPDDILTKVDRASMAVGLEARVPLLDHRVVEYAWTLPLDVKYREEKGKWLLRQVLNRYIPQNLIERPKMGFGVPIDQWLRGPLKDWAEHLLSEQRLVAEGLLNPKPIIQKWKEHLSGRRNWQYALWGVLMFQAWRERWKV